MIKILVLLNDSLSCEDALSAISQLGEELHTQTVLLKVSRGSEDTPLLASSRLTFFVEALSWPSRAPLWMSEIDTASKLLELEQPNLIIASAPDDQNADRLETINTLTKELIQVSDVPVMLVGDWSGLLQGAVS